MAESLAPRCRHGMELGSRATLSVGRTFGCAASNLFWGGGGVFFFFKYHYSLPGLFPKVQPGKKMELERGERGPLDVSLLQTVALRRQACSTNCVPILPAATSGFSIHPCHPSSAWWPCGDTCPMKPQPQGNGAVEEGGRSVPIIAGPGNKGGFVGQFAAYVLVDGIRSSNRSVISQSDELFLWQRRAAAWPFLLGMVTYKSLLPAGHNAPACPFPWARQGHAHPEWAAVVLRLAVCPAAGRAERLSVGSVHSPCPQPGRANAAFSPGRAEAASTRVHLPHGQGWQLFPGPADPGVAHWALTSEIPAVLIEQ